MIKAVVYAFIITSVSAYKGYTVEGGSVQVGKSSTDAVVHSSILVLFSDIFLTSILT
jgi:phospholipid/cholesterol/gamma-HCH transport system permease protein